MQSQNALKHLFGCSLDNVASIKINHLRKGRFRPLSLLELPFYLIGIIISAIIVVVLFFKFFSLGALFDGDNSDMSDSGCGGGLGFGGRDRSVPKFRKNRFYKFSHILKIQFLDNKENVIDEATYQPLNAKDGYDTISKVLELADKESIVVAEKLEFRGERRLSTWFGGLPLLFFPETTNLESVVEIFEKEGYEIGFSEGTYRIERKDEEQHIVEAWLRLIFHSAYLWIPYFFLKANHRADWLKAFYGVRKQAPGKEIMEISADEYRYSYMSDGKKLRPSITVQGKLIQSVQYEPSLGYDKWVSYRPDELGIRTTNGLVILPDSLYSNRYGYQMETMIRLMTLRVRQKSLAYQSGIEVNHPVKCPYCGNVYIVEEAQKCTSCGAYPKAF